MSFRYAVHLMPALIMVCALLFCGGCATTQSRMATRALHEGDYERAIPLFITLTTEQPDDAKVWARLGEAQYRAKHIADSKASFERALSIDPDLPSAHLFLGYISESELNLDQALRHYQIYVDMKRSGSTAASVASRIASLRRQRASQFAKFQIERELDLRPSRYSDSTIGVVYFRSSQLPENLRPLAKGMAEMLVTDLSMIPGLQVVERLKTQKLLDELALSQTAAFDSTTAPRLGKLLGAAHVLGGDASELSHGRLRFDPQIVSTRTGDVQITEEQVGELAEFFNMQKQIVLDVAELLGFTVTEAQGDSIRQIPTESLAAFLAYSRGLDFEDRGQFKNARKEFDRAASLDPGFHEARARADQATLLSKGTVSDNPESVERFSESTSEGSEWTETITGTEGRMNALLNNSGFMTRITTESAGADDPVTPPKSPTTVIIRGRFDDP